MREAKARIEVYVPRFLSGDRLGATKVYEFVSVHQDRYPVAMMRRLLEVSTSGYYAWRKRRPSRRAQLGWFAVQDKGGWGTDPR